MLKPPTLAGFLILAMWLTAGAFAAGGPVSLVESGRGTCVIVFPREDRLLAATAEKLTRFLHRQTDASVVATAADAFTVPAVISAIVLLDGTSDHRLAARFGEHIRLTASRGDAYRLVVRASAEGPALVIAAGKTSSGAKYAAYRLMRELEIEGRSARVRPLDVNCEPFLQTRSIALFNVWSMPIELTRRHNTESWPVERLEQYIDLYDFFGFNAIESHDRFNDNYLEPLFGLSRSDWREKVLRMCDRAHANGQQFFLRIWGHSVMETPKLTKALGPTSSVPRRLRHLCVNDPAERKRWEQEILQYYVSNYAGRIDHLIGHWCDPGVCRQNGCDYRTPLKLQMELHRAFKAVDPKFTSTFSLWFFDVTKNTRSAWARGGWAGYENDLDLINAGILDRDVTIATATTLPGSYKEGIVQAITAAGHKPAVWTWYRADHEIRPSLHVHLHERISEYLRGLPASARELAWHNMERNVHGMANTATYYVAGRLMWEPELNPDDMLNEFLTLVFGRENAVRIQPAYLAIEAIRCHSCYRNWESSRFTGAGTEDPRADFARAEGALAQLQQVRIDSGRPPRLPLDLSPAQIIEDLTASLEVIRDFARCRAEELPRLEQAVAGGDRTTAMRLLDEMQTRYQPWTHTLAGRQEWMVLDGMLKQQRKKLGLPPRADQPSP